MPNVGASSKNPNCFQGFPCSCLKSSTDTSTGDSARNLKHDGVIARLLRGHHDLQARAVLRPFELAVETQEFDILDFADAQSSVGGQRPNDGLIFLPAHHESKKCVALGGEADVGR